MTTGGSGREGGRALKTRVKMTRKRTVASARWLERQLNDPYVAQARREGYRSRAAYKLIEIDDKYKMLKRGERIAHEQSRFQHPRKWGAFHRIKIKVQIVRAMNVIASRVPRI